MIAFPTSGARATGCPQATATTATTATTTTTFDLNFIPYTETNSKSIRLICEMESYETSGGKKEKKF